MKLGQRMLEFDIRRNQRARTIAQVNAMAEVVQHHDPRRCPIAVGDIDNANAIIAAADQAWFPKRVDVPANQADHGKTERHYDGWNHGLFQYRRRFAWQKTRAPRPK